LTFSKLEVCPKKEFFGKLKKLSLQFSGAVLTRVPHTSPVKLALLEPKPKHILVPIAAITMQRQDKRIIQPK